jgi:hypothetical protein
LYFYKRGSEVSDDGVEESACSVARFGVWHILGMAGGFVRRDLLGFVVGERLKGENDGGDYVLFGRF